MNARIAGFVGLVTIGFSGAAQADLLVTRNAEKVGETPSAIADYEMGRSRLIDFIAMPTSHLDAGPPAGSLSASEGGGAFSLSSMSSDLREETAGILTELNATQQDDGSILVALPGDVLFDFDKSDIRADARPVLDQLATVLINYASPKVEISGHTDAKGSDDYNQTLSEQRATAVSIYLSDHGVDPDNLTTIGKGESEPVAANERPDGQDDPEGRQANRRVEFVITPPEAEE